MAPKIPITNLVFSLLTAVFLFGAEPAFADSCRHLDVYSTYFENGSEYYQQGSGSVFRWTENSTNYILTSAHVVAGAARVRALCDGKFLELKVVGQVVEHDLAVLQPLTNSQKLKPLYELPQKPIADEGWVALANTFFFEYRVPEGFDHERISNLYPRFSSDLGLFYLQNGFAIWREKGGPSTRLDRFNASPEWHPFWQLQDGAGFIRFGIQPGMSGSAVIELRDPQVLKDGNQSLVGVVSRSRYLGGISAFVSYTTVNRDLDILMGKVKPADRNMSQWFEFKNGQLNQGLTIKEAGTIWTLNDVCSSASEFAMTADIQKKKYTSKELQRGGGSDWGEGGGGVVSKKKNYYMDPFLIVTLMVPQETCAAKGVKVNDKYIYLFRGQPINSIDDLLSVKRKHPELSYSQIITEGYGKKTHQEAWCSAEFLPGKSLASEIKLVNPEPDWLGEIPMPHTELPAPYVRFDITCSKQDEAVLRFEHFEIKINLSIKDRTKNYSIKIGNCEASGQLPVGNPLTTVIKTNFGKVAITREAFENWKVQLNDIAKCGLSEQLSSPLIYEVFK